MPTAAVVGISLATGLMALLGAFERRPGRGVPSAIPTAMAATSLLLAVGVWLGKGAISPGLGAEVGVEIGLILALITAAVQTIVLAMGLRSRYDDNRSDDPVRSPRRYSPAGRYADNAGVPPMRDQHLSTSTVIHISRTCLIRSPSPVMGSPTTIAPGVHNRCAVDGLESVGLAPEQDFMAEDRLVGETCCSNRPSTASRMRR